MAKKHTPDARYVQTVRVGLGEAIQRLIAVEFRYRHGAGGEEKLLEERQMLLEAMNHIPIDIGFDCNNDGVPDTVAIFQQAASTSCCRLMPYESSRKSPEPPSQEPEVVKKTVVRRSNSRRKEPEPVAPVAPKPEVTPPPDPEPKSKRGLFGLFGKKG